MKDFQFVKYEPQDDGSIVRIILNRPEARNAQNRGLLVELDEAFLAAEADDNVRVVILSGEGKMFSSGHDMGSKVAMAERRGGENPHPTSEINGGTRHGAESLMLQEWHYFFENTRRWRNLRKITIAQVHGDVYSAGLMLMWACDLIVGADDVHLRRRRGDTARHVRHGVLRPPLGVRAPQDEGAHADGRLHRRARGLRASAWSARCSRPLSSPSAPSSSPAASPSVPDHGRAHDQGVGEPDPGQHGLLQLAQRLLHPARAQPSHWA